MAGSKMKPHETPREEDYRDYEDRNLDDGWPYSDEENRPGARNAPYGANPANLDRRETPGAQVSEDTAVHTAQRLAPEPDDTTVDDDGLSDAITRLIDEDERFNADLVTVTVRDGVAMVSGEVETEPERLKLETLVLSVKGVRDVENEIVLIGVDSHVPPDFDE